MVIYAVRILEVDHLPGLSVHEAVYTKPGIRHEMPWKPERLSVNAPGKEPTYIGGIDIYHRTQTSTLEPPGNERAPGASILSRFCNTTATHLPHPGQIPYPPVSDLSH